jgi:hypothetical protein
VSDAPKRSTKDTVTQLVVIALLIAITIVAILYLRSFIASRGSMGPSLSGSTFNVSCCTVSWAGAVHYPGMVVHLA